jgi:hypothetical protein
LLEIKSVVAHFKARHLTLAAWLYISLRMIKELKLGGANHDRMRKWVKTVYVPESTYHRETFPPQRR